MNVKYESIFFPPWVPRAEMKSHDLIILNPCGSSEIGPDVTRRIYRA